MNLPIALGDLAIAANGLSLVAIGNAIGEPFCVTKSGKCSHFWVVLGPDMICI